MNANDILAKVRLCSNNIRRMFETVFNIGHTHDSSGVGYANDEDSASTIRKGSNIFCKLNSAKLLLCCRHLPDVEEFFGIPQFILNWIWRRRNFTYNPPQKPKLGVEVRLREVLLAHSIKLANGIADTDEVSNQTFSD